jgi:UDP-N-acetylmuramyl tripeptide synthase
LLDVWAGKLTLMLLRRLGRGGTTLPGRVARELSPYVLFRLSQGVPRRVLVTGTNGKTTTVRLTAETCRRAGLSVVHNRAGANLAAGLTTAFLAASDWRGRVTADVALLEVDEATAPKVVPEIRPGVLAVTNFFRDQLDRYGEIDVTVRRVEEAARAMGPGRRLLLNGDDPLSVALGARLGGARYFGVRPTRSVADEVLDVRRCPRCGQDLEYAGRTFAHLGDFRCAGCGLARPALDVEAEVVAAGGDGQVLRLHSPAGEATVELPLPGLYNAYNVALAALLADELDVGQHLAAAARGFRTSFGRMERIEVGGRPVTVVLVKNPVAFNEAIRTLEGQSDVTCLLLINDRDADGHDVSWLWDVDFERLAANPGVRAAYTGGLRGPDMAVRLKYAGIGERLVPGEGIEEPFRRALADGNGPLVVFVTYTALLELREKLERAGEVEAFWAE